MLSFRVPTVHEMAPPKHAGLQMKLQPVEGVMLDAKQLCEDLASIGETRPRYMTHDAVPMETGSHEAGTGQPLVHQVSQSVSVKQYKQFQICPPPSR